MTKVISGQFQQGGKPSRGATTGSSSLAMTTFEPAQALIRFVTTLVERSLQENENAPVDRTETQAEPARLTTTDSSVRSQQNANPEE